MSYRLHQSITVSTLVRHTKFHLDCMVSLCCTLGFQLSCTVKKTVTHAPVEGVAERQGGLLGFGCYCQCLGLEEVPHDRQDVPGDMLGLLSIYLVYFAEVRVSEVLGGYLPGSTSSSIPSISQLETSFRAVVKFLTFSSGACGLSPAASAVGNDRQTKQRASICIIQISTCI